MKTEACVHGDPVWTNGVEILSNDECLPIIGNCQLSSILSNLDSQDKNLINNTDDAQAMDIIILQNSNLKLSNVDLNSPEERNYMILKDNKFEQKTNTNKVSKNDKNKSTNLEDLLYFVCNLCPFLCTSNEKISEHLQNAHLNKTVRKQQNLKCPACQNVFYHKISLRSHLIHDHGVSNSDLTQIIQAVVYYAKVKTIKSNEKKKMKNISNKKIKKVKFTIQKSQNDEESPVNELEDNKFNFASSEKINETNPSNVDLKTSRLPQVNIDINKTEQIFEEVDKKSSSTYVNNNIKNAKLHLCLSPLCRVKMEDLSKLQYHFNSHSNTNFKCLECDQEFNFWSSLSTHLWRSHKIDMELYSCNQCDYKTYSLSKLNNIHKLIHTNVKNFICNICQKAFKNSKQMRNHRTIHKEKSEKLIHECEVCSRKFSDRRQVKIHMDTVHKKIKPFLCSSCGHRSSSRSSLKIHIRQHTGEKPFACDSCTYTTADHNSLRRHKLRHTGDKPYKCAYCSYACIQSSTYKMHLKTKHPGQENDLMFTCSECQFRTVNKDIFLTHMISVHKQKQMDNVFNLCP